MFDERLGESIDGKVIAACHQLFIKCEACKSSYDGCCSAECQEIFHLPHEEQVKYRGLKPNHYSQSKIYMKEKF